MKTLTAVVVFGWVTSAALSSTILRVTPQAPKANPARWAGFVEPTFPFFSSVLDARKLGPGWPADNLTPRGLILNLGHDAWACFDTDLLRVSAIWIGSGVTPVSMSQGSYQNPGEKAPEGQGTLPQIVGTPWIANGIYPGWQTGETISLTDPRDPGPDPKEVGRGPIDPAVGRFKAVRVSSNSASLEYEVAGASVREFIIADIVEGQLVIQRRFGLVGVKQPLWLVLGRRPAEATGRLDLLIDGTQVAGRPDAVRIDRPDGLLAVRVNPSTATIELNATLKLSGAPTSRTSSALPVSNGPARRWPQSVITRGVPSTTKDAYVVDRISLPLNNPWRRNVRLADLAFFGDGRAAAVTFDGDVWMISGLRGELSEVHWNRFTSGLHEPIAIAIRAGELFVFDRNGIWRLRDTNGNGEADVHELFSNAFVQTAETREFASSMRVAPDGTFVIAKGGQEGTTIGKDNGAILRISADGKSATKLAYGLRQPFVSVHPKTGLVTASDQQGNYIPSTPLHVIRGGQYYGFIPLILPKEQYPAPIAEPLMWIPHAVNASAAEQVWLVDAKMGPLNDALIHIGYYRPELFLVRLNERGARLQAAVVSLTRNLDFAPLAGAVSPADGQLYVTGFQIWGTEAKDISGLARYRYTGAPTTLPREVVPMDKGVLLRFDVALDPRSATDPANYSAERWNYVRTANYGSPHFKLDGSKGQDTMTPSSAYLSRDGKTVFLGLPDMQPVMQMRVGWSLKTRAGAIFEQNAYLTPYELASFTPSTEGFDPFTVDLSPHVRRAPAATTPVTVDEGKRISQLMGCMACHSTDGTVTGKVGPSWKGIYGTERTFTDGSKAVADEAYLRQSIREPRAKVVRGFDQSDSGMPSYEGVLNDAQIEALILYIRSLK